MAKNYGTSLGCVLVTAKYTPWKAVLDVMYKDDSVLILRDWPNTRLPMYFLVAKEMNDAAWNVALRYMSTLNTGGIQCSPLNYQINSDFDAIKRTFITRENEREINERLRAGETIVFADWYEG